MSRPQFLMATTDEMLLLRFATILGFIGMLRPHSLDSLGPKSFSIVTKDGEDISMPGHPQRFQCLFSRLYVSRRIRGVYITFRSKTLHQAKAYFPVLCDREHITEFSLICPVAALSDVSQRGLLIHGFLHPLNKKMRLTK